MKNTCTFDLDKNCPHVAFFTMQTERGNLPEKSLISRNPQKFLEIPKLFKSLHFPMRVGYNSKHPEGEGICMFFLYGLYDRALAVGRPTR